MLFFLRLKQILTNWLEKHSGNKIKSAFSSSKAPLIDSNSSASASNEKKSSNLSHFLVLGLLFLISCLIFCYFYHYFQGIGSNAFAAENENTDLGSSSSASGGSGPNGLNWTGLLLATIYMVIVLLVQFRKKESEERGDEKDVLDTVKEIKSDVVEIFEQGTTSNTIHNYEMNLEGFNIFTMKTWIYRENSWILDFLCEYWPVFQHGIALVGGALIFQYFWNSGFKMEFRKEVKEQLEHKKAVNEEIKTQFKKEEEIKDEGYDKRWERYKNRTELQETKNAFKNMQKEKKIK